MVGTPVLRPHYAAPRCIWNTTTSSPDPHADRTRAGLGIPSAPQDHCTKAMRSTRAALAANSNSLSCARSAHGLTYKCSADAVLAARRLCPCKGDDSSWRASGLSLQNSWPLAPRRPQLVQACVEASAVAGQGVAVPRESHGSRAMPCSTTTARASPWQLPRWEVDPLTCTPMLCRLAITTTSCGFRPTINIRWWQQGAGRVGEHVEMDKGHPHTAPQHRGCGRGWQPWSGQHAAQGLAPLLDMRAGKTARAL